MKKKRKELSFPEKIRKIKKAGLEGALDIKKLTNDCELEPLPQRIKKILKLAETTKDDIRKMIYFIMYDIEDNKVRVQVAKYLIRKGCTRVQKSIFLARTDRIVFEQIKNDLLEVQQCYENNDSIFIVPVSTDEIKAMKVIGQNIDFDLILQNKNTLFF